MQLVARLFVWQPVWWLAIGSTLLGVVGQLMFRRFGIDQAGLRWPLEAMPQGLGWLVVGGLCYLLAVLLWVNVLQKLTLARAYPLLSLGYPLVYVGAITWLGESATPARTVGTLLVCTGVLLAVAPVEKAGAAFESTAREGLELSERSSGSSDP